MVRKLFYMILIGIFFSSPLFVWAADMGEIQSGETRTGYLRSSDSYQDSWTFYGDAGDRVVISTANIGGGVEPCIYLYPPAGGQLEDSVCNNSLSHSLDHQLLATGLYTVIIRDYLMNEEGDYGISLAKIPGAATSSTDSDGGSIASGQTLTGTLSYNADTDIFQFYGDAGDRVVISTANIGGGVEPCIYLYPPAGGQLEDSVCNNSLSHSLDHQLLATGLYTVIIRDYLMNEEGDYGISLAKIPGAATSSTDSDGGSIASGQTLTGTLSYNADTDIFQFYGDAGDRVVISTASIGGGVEPCIYLYPPAGGQLEDSVCNNSLSHSLDHQLLATGLYTVIIRDYLMNEEGDYNISLTKIPSTLRPGIYNPSPSNGESISNLDGSFSWDPVAGVTGYDLYFGENVTEPLVKIGDNLTSNSMPFPEMEWNKVYYWHVVAHTPSRTIMGPYWWFQTIDNGADKDFGYAPVSPCRIVDTRLAGGAMSSGTIRGYNVWGNVASQGGNPAGCPSPSGEPYAVHINVTAVPVSGSGNIVAYPFASSAPTASLVNYKTGAQNIANGGTIKTCYNCDKDINIKSNYGTTHVVIDVLGYYFDNPWH